MFVRMPSGWRTQKPAPLSLGNAQSATVLVAAASNCGIIEVAKGKSNDAAQAPHEIPLPGRRLVPSSDVGRHPFVTW